MRTAYAEIYANWSTNPQAPTSTRWTSRCVATAAELPARRRHQHRPQRAAPPYQIYMGIAQRF
jgi:hypothetical protein